MSLEGELERRICATFPLDLEAFDGEPSWTPPMPARCRIDRAGVIRAARSDPDDTVRPDPADTLEARRTLSPPR
jgi:hypothetical protein